MKCQTCGNRSEHGRFVGKLCASCFSKMIEGYVMPCISLAGVEGEK